MKRSFFKFWLFLAVGLTVSVFNLCSTLPKGAKNASDNFVDNQGRLPWPTEKGIISGHYGKQSHPFFTNITIENKGVNIQTSTQSDARAVFEGTVVQRFSVAESNNGVIVRHGEYFTVYGNLTEIYVNVGDMINAKQAIGKIYTDIDNKTELYFQVWKETNPLNPEEWLVK